METTAKSKTVFIEYSSSEKGQHFITVVQTIDHKRTIIGRIYREFDKETKKPNYYAKDFDGNQVFADITELYALKKNFIEHGKNLADMEKMTQLKKVKQQEKPVNSMQKAERTNSVKTIRDKKFTKEKTKEITKQNPNEKAKNTQIEKEQDLNNTTKFKESETTKEVNHTNEKNPEQEASASNSENSIQEEPIENEKSEREAELENIREQNEDREEEIER